MQKEMQHERKETTYFTSVFTFDNTACFRKDDGNDKSADESKGESNADTTSGETGLLDGKTAEEILDIALEKFSAINNLTFEGLSKSQKLPVTATEMGRNVG